MARIPLPGSLTEYETIIVAQPDLDETSAQTLTDKMRGICAKDGAHFLAWRDWGVRKLAFEINKQRRGRYFYINYLGNERIVPEVERNLRFDEKILRFLTVAVNEIEDIPARIEAAKTQKEGAAPTEQLPFVEGPRYSPRHGGGMHHDDSHMGEEEM